VDCHLSQLVNRSGWRAGNEWYSLNLIGSTEAVEDRILVSSNKFGGHASIVDLGCGLTIIGCIERLVCIVPDHREYSYLGIASLLL
jgi:hypothetical protein